MFSHCHSSSRGRSRAVLRGVLYQYWGATLKAGETYCLHILSDLAATAVSTCCILSSKPNGCRGLLLFLNPTFFSLALAGVFSYPRRALQSPSFSSSLSLSKLTDSAWTRFPLCFCPVVLFFSYCTHFCLCLVILQAQRNDAAASRVRPLRRRMFLINIYIFIWTAECEATSSTLFIVTLRLWVRACFFSLETKLKCWHDYRKSNNGTSSPETNSKKPKSSVKVCTQLLMWHLCIFIKVSP